VRHSSASLEACIRVPHAACVVSTVQGPQAGQITTLDNPDAYVEETCKHETAYRVPLGRFFQTAGDLDYSCYRCGITTIGVSVVKQNKQ
jgi:hypothetical protein